MWMEDLFFLWYRYVYYAWRHYVGLDPQKGKLWDTMYDFPYNLMKF